LIVQLCGPKLQADKGAFSVAEIADNSTEGLRQSPYERRDRNDLVSSRELRIPRKIDDFDRIPALQVFFAQPLEIGECSQRLRSLPCGIEPKFPFFISINILPSGLYVHSKLHRRYLPRSLPDVSLASA
jgi:hypothetical protein